MTCYYCGSKSVTTEHDVPVCKDHKPEDPPTDRMQVAEYYLGAEDCKTLMDFPDIEAYGPY